MNKLATRRLDELGRIALPPNGPEGWDVGSFIDIYMDGQNRLILDKSLEPQMCALCGSDKHLYQCNDYPVCFRCFQTLLEQVVAEKEARGGRNTPPGP